MSEPTPGPWRVGKSTKPQVRGDYYVVRDLRVDSSFSHYEQLRDADGVLRQFETEQEAMAAITEATDASPEGKVS